MSPGQCAGSAHAELAWVVSELTHGHRRARCDPSTIKRRNVRWPAKPEHKRMGPAASPPIGSSCRLSASRAKAILAVRVAGGSFMHSPARLITIPVVRQLSERGKPDFDAKFQKRLIAGR